MILVSMQNSEISLIALSEALTLVKSTGGAVTLKTDMENAAQTGAEAGPL